MSESLKNAPWWGENYPQKSEMYEEIEKKGLVQSVAVELDHLVAGGIILFDEIDQYLIDRLKNLNENRGIRACREYGSKGSVGIIDKRGAFFASIIGAHQHSQDAELQGVEQHEGDDALYGPDQAKIKELIESSGYELNVSTGQRRYGPPPAHIYEGEKPNTHECFVGSIPRDAYEDTLVPILQEAGTIWEVRLMMAYDGLNRGYCFVIYTDKEAVEKCKEVINGRELNGRKMHVNVSIPATRLFIGSLLKDKTADEYKIEMEANGIEGIKEVIMYDPIEGQSEGLINRGFCFVEFDDHLTASKVKKELMAKRILLFNRYCINIDWADAENKPDSDEMEKVKNLYVTGWDEVTTESDIQAAFSRYGDVEKVKKINNFSFVHFTERENALKAIEELHETEVLGCTIKVSLAKPNDTKLKQKKQNRNFNKYGGGGNYGGWGGGNYGNYGGNQYYGKRNWGFEQYPNQRRNQQNPYGQF